MTSYQVAGPVVAGRCRRARAAHHLRPRLSVATAATSALAACQGEVGLGEDRGTGRDSSARSADSQRADDRFIHGLLPRPQDTLANGL